MHCDSRWDEPICPQNPAKKILVSIPKKVLNFCFSSYHYRLHAILSLCDAMMHGKALEVPTNGRSSQECQAQAQAIWPDNNNTARLMYYLYCISQ